jgi:endonuclease-8
VRRLLEAGEHSDREGEAPLPEGHIIHRLARDLGELQGAPLRASSPQGRFSADATGLDGARVVRIEPFGKHLFVCMSTDVIIHVHLGMQGKWLRSTNPTGTPLKQVRLRLATPLVAWDLIAPSVCELLDEDGMARVTSRLGPDPLRADSDAVSAVAALASDRRPIGSALLDQAVVAGVGNVFRNEALHAVGVNPGRAAGSMDLDQLGGLWRVLRTMMGQAVEDGRIITVDVVDRLSLPESQSRRVYKQEYCRDCGAPVTISTVGGRKAYFCPVEQAT